MLCEIGGGAVYPSVREFFIISSIRWWRVDTYDYEVAKSWCYALPWVDLRCFESNWAYVRWFRSKVALYAFSESILYKYKPNHNISCNIRYYLLYLNQLNKHESINAINMATNTIGVPAHIKGYQYLREAIIIAVNDMDDINAIT